MEVSKFEVPQFVADWFVENVNIRGVYALTQKLLSDEAEEFESVYDWFTKVYYNVPCFEDEVFFTLSNMAQFGYTIDKDEYYIQTPSTWDNHDVYYVYRNYYHENTCYFMTPYKSEGTIFTNEEAKKVMELLKVDWDIVKVTHG